ncbi:MAG: RNA polymerase sigma factor RpoH [Rhodocyclaceae bacterium]|jgi:RNA polymerase sigma-32 factor|nr:RNA polymerase sigma factor RpoH [Rhodocyclaceae bacterium]
MSSALTLPVPSVAGSLESYIQTTKRFPLLSEEQEVDLARRFRREGDLNAAGQLVTSHLRLVVAVARGYLGYGLPHADLIQEGNVGLMKAVKRYDPERGVRLVSFAIHWIKAEIHEYILRNWRLVKIATTKAQRKLFFNLRSLKQGLNTMSPDEVGAMAKQLGVKPEEVVEMETRLSGQDIALEPNSEDEEDRYSPIAYLADPHAEPSEALAELEMQRLQDEGLKQALASLDERSRRIVERRWLAEGESATLHELAAEYGVSAERIRQIEAKAMQKMKGMLVRSV